MPIKDGFVHVDDKVWLALQMPPEPQSSPSTPDDCGEFIGEAMPPCILNIVHKARDHINLTQTERFAAVAFLNGVGLDMDEIGHLFSRQPDFDSRITDYQIDHIIANGYKCPSCETMRFNGHCERDRICGGVRHPINCYKRLKRKMGYSRGT